MGLRAVAPAVPAIHGQSLNIAIRSGTGRTRDIKAQTFTERTGIKAGHGFAFPLPDGRFGLAIHLASDRRGYLLLDISASVTDQPASPDALRPAPGRYRQPILLWHPPFAVQPLAQSVSLAALPCGVVFRCSQGWPSVETVTGLERRFAVSGTDTPAGWNALLSAMAKAGERLPGLRGCSVWTARAGRTGALKLIEDCKLRRFVHTGDRPTPWHPADMEEIMAVVMGGADMIAISDQVT